MWVWSTCDIREYLDHENCKCRKKLVDKLIKECGENIDENKMISVTFIIMEVNAIFAQYTLYYLSLFFNNHRH